MGGIVTAPSLIAINVEGITAENIHAPNQQKALELWGARISLAESCRSDFVPEQHGEFDQVQSLELEFGAVILFS